MTVFYIFLCSFMASLLFAALFIKIKGGTKKVSCIGGIAIYAAFLIAISAAIFLKELGGLRVLGLIVSSGIIMVLGLIDDANELRPSLKVTGEFLGIGVLVAFGFTARIAFLPIWANVLITVFWMLFITNAFNLLDIMDGLASGLVIIISLTFLSIAVINRDSFSMFILVALIGAHLGFLKYNYPPAKVYMGDAGSLFSGFLLAAVAININYTPIERPVALFAPILALSLPIYDTIFLTIMRIRKKIPIFSKSNDHIALRLLTVGCSVRKSLWAMYFFGIFLAISALIITFSPTYAGLVMTGVVFLIFILVSTRVAVLKME
ncbi:MAG: undecaprenyl/decaprenyl-phosphate alpha-N-acetylglucosaminyl 1-phosphate transferase [Candidatus Omnitrophica bacterium]|nr:undecaprenyl/decaprenyl-phosphate alpha-N-acetylglucosaminyl 1-phosphate transferase [Candidatus Omnitrophota bacterium]